MARRIQGYTTTEILVVIIIIGVIAVAIRPQFGASDSAKVDYAATKVAEAIRYARSEAMRSGDTWGATISQTSQNVRVRRYDTTQDPVDPVETFYHPVEKQLLDFDFDDEATTLGVLVTNAQDAFDYPGAGRRKTVLFDEQGTPIWIMAAGTTTLPLLSGSVELTLGGYQRKVLVASVTGRVSIQ